VIVLARLFVTTLLAAGISAAHLSLPARVLACSCMPDGPADIGKAGDFDGGVVFIGLVTSMDPAGPGQDFSHRFGEMRIERLFKGTMPAVVRVMGGGGGDCTMHLAVGQHMITVGSYVGNVLTPGLCNPYGDPNTADGQALIAAAVAAYGPGVTPPPTPAEPDPQAMPDDPSPAGFVIGMVGIIALVLVIAVATSAWRSRSEPTA
jgi:hypothetical protein